MGKREFTYPSADGRTLIHAVVWTPEGPVRGVLQIAHGVAEYIGRYEPFARWLTDRGFAVAGNDHIGHGQSLAPGAARLYFGPRGSWNWVAEDVYALRRRMGEEFPGAPYFLLGHSMGSFLARTYLIRWPGTVDGAILMGTGAMSPPVIAAGRAIAARESRRVGEEHISPVVDRLSFDTYNRVFAPNRTRCDWLSVDEANVDAYIADPLCGGNASIGLFREMLDGIAFIQRRENLRKMDPDTPVLLISGSMDPVGNRGKGVRQVYRAFQRAGVRDVTLRLCDGARHEILNDLWKETVYRDIESWMSARLPRKKENGV